MSDSSNLLVRVELTGPDDAVRAFQCGFTIPRGTFDEDNLAVLTLPLRLSSTQPYVLSPLNQEPGEPAPGEPPADAPLPTGRHIRVFQVSTTPAEVEEMIHLLSDYDNGTMFYYVRGDQLDLDHARTLSKPAYDVVDAWLGDQQVKKGERVIFDALEA